MTVKKQYSKKRMVSKRRPKQFKKSIASKELIIYKAPQQSPFPARFRTVFTSYITGSILAADAIAAGRYYVSLNGPQLPWSGGGWPHVLTSNLTTLNPLGYSTMLNANMYLAGRCYASSISVEFLPQALTDTIECTVTPSYANGTPATVDVAMASPFTKQQFFSSSKSNSKNSGPIKNYQTVHRQLGVSKRAVEDDLSGQLNFAVNGDPTRQFYWVVNWAAPDAANLAAACEYRCKVRYYVEMFNQTPSLLQT